MNKRTLWLVDMLYVIALGVYVVAGMPLAPFHGDEAMQIYMSRDYVSAFVEGRWSELTTQPPYDIDSDAHLRLINGTVNRYAIGLTWQIAGYTPNDLPPRPGWDWGLNYQENVETNHRSADGALTAARLPSALFTAISVGALFLIGRQVGGRPAAYVAAAVYALNPAILINGRRALQEGSMLFFGLMTVLIAVWMSRRERKPIWAWVALIISGALTLASKHSGVVFVVAAWGWITVETLVKPAANLTSPLNPLSNWRGDCNGTPAISPLRAERGLGGEVQDQRILNTHGTGSRIKWLIGLFAALNMSGIVVIAGFVALSPALWNDPPARIVNLLEERARLLDIQVAIDPIAPMTFGQRIEAALVQPAIAPLMVYELTSWAAFEPIRIESERYAASGWSGYASLIGVLIMLLVGVGVVITVRRWRRYAGVIVWFGVVGLSLLVNPLPWQRYYLPAVPVIAVLVGLAGAELLKVRRAGKDKEKSLGVEDKHRGMR